MASLHHGDNWCSLLQIEESHFFHRHSASSCLLIQTIGRSRYKLSSAVANVQTVQEWLVGMCAMGCSPLELDGTSVSEGINTHTVSAESRSNGLGFGSHAEDI